MSDQLSPKKEYVRLRRELGAQLKYRRKLERLSAETIAKQNGLSDVKELYQLESGEFPTLGKYFQLVNYYGMQLHLSIDFKEGNLNKKLRRSQAEESKHWFLQMWSGILQNQRWFHHYTLEELSAMTGVPADKIRKMEENEEDFDFSLDEACLLLAYFNKNLLPETHRLEY